MWAVIRRYPVAVPVAAALLVAAGWLWFARVGPQLADTGAQQAIYDRFAPYPGSDQVSSRRYEHLGDGRPTGRHGLEVVYRVPENAAAADVLDHYRRQIPPRWSEASDQTCLDVMGRLPTPPVPAPGQPAPSGPDPDSFGLQLRGSRLTVFTDAAAPAAGRIEGFTLTLSRSDNGKFVTLDSPTYSCGGDGEDEAAVAFDAP